MIAITFLLVRVLCDCFKPRRRLEAEILVLQHQLNILQQRAPRRPHLRWADRALFIWLYRRCPRILGAITIVRPETVVHWHRMGFAAYWRWESRPLGGRPRIGKEMRDLIRRMSFENPLWGAPKIHGELLKLGIEIAQSTVSIYMVPRQDRPLQTWKTFLRNHMEGIASIGLFVVPTIAFEQLFAFLVLGHCRRQLLWIAVTRNPTAEWLARQITEAFPWDKAPRYLIRDNDRAFGVAFKDRVRAMGIRDRPISFRSPWQNGYVERLIGSIRRECTDHLIVFNAEHLRRIQRSTPHIITKCELTFRSGRTCPAHARSNGSEILWRIRSLADCTIDTHGSSFQKRQGPTAWLRRRRLDPPSPRSRWPLLPASIFLQPQPSAKSPSSRGGESELGKLESSNSRCHSVSLICLIHSITSSASSKNSRLIVSPTARAVLQVDDQLEFSPAGQLEPPILAGEHRSRLGRALGLSNSW
jgi:hypothetical protein